MRFLPTSTRVGSRRAAFFASCAIVAVSAPAYAQSAGTPPAAPSAPAAPPPALAQAAPPPAEPAPAAPAAPGAPVTPPPADAYGTPPADTAAPKPPKPPYSLPWQLRPVVVGNVVRSDTALAFWKNAKDESGSTQVSTLLATYKVTPEFAPLVRVGIVSSSPPAPADPGGGFLNPVLGATYALQLAPGIKFAAFLGLTIPVGSGGGDKPDAAVTGARGAGALARSAFDNAMFAVNYFTIFPGVDIAYVGGGLTVQGEATLFQLTRVKGENFAPDKDKARTNLTMGLHVGYFIVPMFSLGADLRYQRWLKNTTIADDAAARDNATFAVGPRVHIKIGDSMWLRPGIAYARGLDKPLTDPNKENIVQIDVPFAF